MELPKNETILSGLQPSGTVHIGNYLGAIKLWIDLQENNTTFFPIVDLHAITVDYDPQQLPTRILDTVATYLALGLDPKQGSIFIQSHVPAHTELAWLLTTQTPFGELTRMTQFKEKASPKALPQNPDCTTITTRTTTRSYDEEEIPPIAKDRTISVGLFSYPVLMAADILLYQTTIVPVGEDQIQHIELARDIAKRFNNKFGDTFTIPKPLVNKHTARIMSLTDPEAKMSKSDQNKSYIAVTDDADTIQKKISSAVTETEPVFSFSDSGPAVKNLLTIYKAFSQKEESTIEQKFTGQGYKKFKEDLAKLIIDKLTPIREKYEEFRSDEANLKKVLAEGAATATETANATLSKVKQAMGLTI